MNRETVEKYLKITSEGSQLTNRISFARANMEDVERIEKLTDKELEQEYHSLIWVVCIYGQSSVSDCQMLSLYEMEIADRPDYFTNEWHQNFSDWFEQAHIRQNREDERQKAEYENGHDVGL